LPGYPPTAIREKEVAMSTPTKTQLDHVNDALKQLKEMRHYSKHNVEQLTTQWLLFDGELKSLKQADVIENLMTRQAELHDALEAEIGELEALALELQPPPEENAAA
jgi:hypothetical protein